MTPDTELKRPLIGALAVVTRGTDVLLVQRGKEPNKGLWGFPGGHVEWGETVQAAAIRELQEETGLIAKADRDLGNLDLIVRNPDGTTARHYLLVAIGCTWISGEPVPADDAADAAWISPDRMKALPLSANVDRVLGWHNT